MNIQYIFVNNKLWGPQDTLHQNPGSLQQHYSILRQIPAFYGRSQHFTTDPSILRQIPAFYGRSQHFTADPSILRQFCCCPAFYKIPGCRVSRGGSMDLDLAFDVFRIISVNDLLIIGIPVPIVNRSLPLGGQETSTVLSVVAHSPLSSIKMRPNDVKTEHTMELLKRLYFNEKDLKIERHEKYRKKLFKVGDVVRFIKDKKFYPKEADQRWTTELYKIRKVERNNFPITYLLSDNDGYELPRSFYREELRKT